MSNILKHTIYPKEISWLQMKLQYCSGSSTIELKGSKTVALASTRHDKLCVTVMLAACASGLKKRPTIVFKGKFMNIHISVIHEGKLIQFMKERNHSNVIFAAIPALQIKS